MSKVSKYQAAKAGCEAFGCITVMKGARTVIADSQQVWLNLYGNDGMAAGGSGDVLTGIIGSLLAQGAEPADTAKAGVLLHALAGDAAAAVAGFGAGIETIRPDENRTLLPQFVLQLFPEHSESVVVQFLSEIQ